MTVATFLQSNYNTQSGTAYPLAIDGDLAVLAQVAAQFAPHAAATPAMTLVIDGGAVFDGANLTAVAAQTSAAIAAPASGLLRIDRVVLDQATGTASVLTGAAVSASPAPPAIPPGRLPCAQIALTSATTAITNDLITDERSLAALGLGSAARYAIGTAGAAVPLLSGANTWSGTQSFTDAPTAPTPAYGDSTTKLATMAAIIQAFTGGQSLGGAGYQKLPGGLILQWGNVITSPTPTAGTTVTFPIAFPTAALLVGAFNSSSSVSGATVTAVTITASNFQIASSIANLFSYWIAFGH